jgi:hypothetical protein
MKARHQIAAALSFLLSANIVLALVCEVRCDVPQANAPIAGCHESSASNAASQASFTIDGVDDRCTHDALPAVVAAALQKEWRAAIDQGPVPGQAPAISQVVTALWIADHATPVAIRPSSLAVLRI